MSVALTIPILRKSLILTENKPLRYSMFAMLYFAQGIMEGFVFCAFPIWMAANGRSTIEIAGFLSITLIPWSFKFLIGPVLDKYTYLPMGRKRPWIIAAQVSIFFGFFAMSFLSNPFEQMPIFIALAFSISLFTAFQDVATDGLAIEITPKEEQEKVNSFMWGSKIISISLWLSGGTFLIGKFGFQVACLFPAAAVLGVAIAMIMVRERKGEKTLPWTAGKSSDIAAEYIPETWKKLINTIWKLISKRTNLWFIPALFLTGVAYYTVDTLNKIFLVQELLWSDMEASDWSSTCILISGGTGLIFGGALIKRIGKWNMIKICILLLAAICVAMGLFDSYWNEVWVIKIYTLAAFMFYTFSCISILTLAMGFCDKQIAATQFTIYMAAFNTGGMVGTYLLGELRLLMEWQAIFYSVIIISLCAFLVIRYAEKVLLRTILNYEPIDESSI